MKEIGAYFELELRRGPELHAGALRFNSGRNCLEYILQERRYRRVYVPFYCCDALLEGFRRTGTEYQRYHINKLFEPVFTTPVADDEALLYVNYFGICDAVVDMLAKESSRLIVDNSQAFFSTAVSGIDTFYSPRKFLGVPDGGYLYTTLAPPDTLEEDHSFGRFRHLLLRIDADAAAGYNAYRRNEQRIDRLPLRCMSRLTHRLLCSIDYDWVKQIRESNFDFMHAALSSSNELSLDIKQLNGPLVYPYFTKNGDNLRAFLRNNHVYCATYWPDDFEYLNPDTFEGRLPLDLVALPVDQRLTNNDMNTVLDLISRFEKSPR